MVTVGEVLNLLVSTGFIYIGIAALVIMGLITIALYLMGKPREVWDYIEEVINYLAIIGGVLLAIAIINKVLIGSLTIDPYMVYKTIYDYAWNAVRFRAWLIWNTCTCPLTYPWCDVRQIQTENATLILESTEDVVPMMYLAQWVPGIASLLISLGLGLSVSRLRSIGSLLIAIGLGLYVVVIGGAAVIASQPFYTAMINDHGSARRGVLTTLITGWALAMFMPRGSAMPMARYIATGTTATVLTLGITSSAAK